MRNIDSFGDVRAAESVDTFSHVLYYKTRYPYLRNKHVMCTGLLDYSVDILHIHKGRQRGGGTLGNPFYRIFSSFQM